MDKKGADMIIPIIGFVMIMLIFAIFILTAFANKSKPECLFPVEVDCVNYQINNGTQNTISLKLKNNIYQDVNITYVEVVGSKCSYGITSSVNGSREWQKDTILWLSFHCKEINPEDKYALINIEVRSNFDGFPLKYSGKVKYYE